MVESGKGLSRKWCWRLQEPVQAGQTAIERFLRILMNLLCLLLTVFALSFLAPFVVQNKSLRGIVLAVLPASLFFTIARYIPNVSRGEVIQLQYNWLPSLNLSIGLYVDGLGVLISLIVTLFGVLIIIYAAIYFQGSPKVNRFFLVILLFMASMTGVVLADNLLTMFIFWELTSLTSFLLIGFNHEEEEGRWAALQALLITGGGGLALLAGIVLLSTITGGYGIAEVLSQGELIQNHPYYAVVMGLICLGAFTKSAQFPFHFWLPGAMHAPTPVSAYLHSATMVKAGVYLLARLSPALGGTALWTVVLVVVGGITMTLASILALPQTDQKKLLAYTTISALGLMVMMIGVGTAAALTAALLFFLVHALYKGALFMVSGTIYHLTHSRDVKELRGLKRLLLPNIPAAMLAVLSMCGIPPLLGFIAKEILYDAQLAIPVWGWVILALSIFANAVNVKVGVLVGIWPFFGKLPEKFKALKKDFSPLWFGPSVAGLLSLGLFFFPSYLADGVMSPALSAVSGTVLPASFELGENSTLVLSLSGATLILGLILFYFRSLFQTIATHLSGLSKYTLTYRFKTGFYTLLSFYGRLTKFIQHGSLNGYLVVIFLVMALSVFSPFLYMEGISLNIATDDIRLLEVGIALLVISGAVLTLLARVLLFGVIALGVVGAGTALFYMVNGAPDVAITQLVVETLTVVLFMLVLYRFPRMQDLSEKSAKIRDGILSLLVGCLMAGITLLAYHETSLNKISRYFIENSLPKAHGGNIVNVILVDFRGIDTLGEITVLTIAALGIIGLLRLKIRKKEK